MKDKTLHPHRQMGTIIRDNMIHDLYASIIKELGELSPIVPRKYIYDRIKEKTGLSVRWIQYILSHTKKTDGTIYPPEK